MHPELNLKKSDDDEVFMKMKPKGILARAAAKMKAEELKKQEELSEEATEAIMSPEYQSQLKKTFKELTKSKKMKNIKKSPSIKSKRGKDKKVHIDMEDAEMIAESLLGSS